VAVIASAWKDRWGMKIGLVLGGGGLVGIAWELGVMAGLEERAGFDPAALSLIVGTSAGSVAGAQVALGKDLGELVEGQRRTAGRPNTPPPRLAPDAAAPRGTTVIPDAIMQLLVSNEGSIEARAVQIGKLAGDAPVALSETDYVESFRRMLGTDEWPAPDLRVTTAECETGRGVLWTKHDGIGLLRAVASSCAIPGFFPTVGFGGRRYMDGPRGGFYAPLVAEKGLDAVLFIGPLGALPEGLRGNPEIDALAAGGLPVVQITGGAGLAAAASDLMDPGGRARAVDAGIDDGRAAAAEVARSFR
jgi:NTE family protein